MSLNFATSSISMVRGLTWSDTVQLVESDSGDPIDLTGVTTITMRVRRTIGTATALLELSTTDGRLTVLDAATGTIAIYVDAEDTLDLPINSHRKAKYVYDCVLSRGGSPEVLEPGFKGKLSVYPQTTRVLAEP